MSSSSSLSTLVSYTANLNSSVLYRLLYIATHINQAYVALWQASYNRQYRTGYGCQFKQYDFYSIEFTSAATRFSASCGHVRPAREYGIICHCHWHMRQQVKPNIGTIYSWVGAWQSMITSGLRYDFDYYKQLFEALIYTYIMQLI